MARIRKLSIRNFRSAQSLDWTPSPGIKCLVRPGDSGKSSILDAIDLCLGSRTHKQDGVITISSPNLSVKDVQKLMKLAIKIDGTLEVVLPTNATIISHNATSEPKFFGLFGTYS
jgi:predicted ATP-binding protein involved in virulence